MELLRQITKVEALPDFLLRVAFDTGEEGVFDVKPLLGYPCYRRLREEFYFTQAKSERGTVVWPHDEDLSPELVWEKCALPDDSSTRCGAPHL